MPKSDTGQWQAALEGFTKESFEADGKRRDIYRAGSGPAVIVISEMPGITPLVAEFARKVVAAGCTAVMPSIFGDPGRPASGAYLFQSIGPACVSREFTAFALKKTSPITVWLRKLAAAEHERCGGPGVGVVGMCFTGGFALAMMVDDIVLAPVLSQPSLPFPLSKKYKADIGISEADLARVKERTAQGTCLLGLRFTNDPFCFEERFATLKRELGDANTCRTGRARRPAPPSIRPWPSSGRSWAWGRVPARRASRREAGATRCGAVAPSVCGRRCGLGWRRRDWPGSRPPRRSGQWTTWG
jgi:dienelactone hydrolase